MLPGTSIIQALAYCRLGGPRPEQDGAFEEAKALGLLAQDPSWRATERGLGALVAAGLLPGKQAPRRIMLDILWATSDRYPEAQYVGSWVESVSEMDPDRFDWEVEDAKVEFEGYSDDGPWTYWIEPTYIERPKTEKEADNVAPH